MTGEQAVVAGIVTRVETGTGFFIEEPESDASSRTSNAIFIEDILLAREAEPGQLVVLEGQVAELGKARDTLTALTGISQYQLCADGNDLPLSSITLPLDSRRREAIEGMRIRFEQALQLADVYKLYRGEFTLSANGPLRIPTEDHSPGRQAEQAAKLNRNRFIYAALAASSPPVFPSGMEISRPIGVMGNKGKGHVFLFESDPPNGPGPLPDLNPPPPETIRVASFNLLNFFNGNGRGEGFPTARGAKSHDKFIAQSDRIQSAISIMQAHLVAVQELENDGFGQHSAARSLLELLNRAGKGNWKVVKSTTGRVGKDVIAVGLFFRNDVLEAVGPSHILATEPFSKLNRQPLAQLFRDRNSGQLFLVAANHLKSKGSCPKSGNNKDRKDGQGCWNSARTAAADAVSDWALGLAGDAGTDLVLVLGDMNSYRQEDPVKAFRQKGFSDLIESLNGLPQFSYVYRGEAGTLDYIFANDAMLPLCRQAQIWHINAPWPQQMKLPEPWLRSSDHDPVVVDLDFSQTATSD